MQKIFGGFAAARRSGDPVKAFTELQQELCNEAPELIRLGQLNIKDTVGLLTTIEDRMQGKDDDDKASAEAKMRNFLTLEDEPQQHKPTPRSKTSVQ